MAPAGAGLTTSTRLLAGPAFARGAESFDEHRARLGTNPLVDARGLIAELETSGLLGRGGAGFPVGTKWRSVADRAAGAGAAVLVNGAEGEPLSRKDQALLALRPHLVLDGAELAASAVGAAEIVVYVGAEHASARTAAARAIAERRASPVSVRLALAPARYVAGEESAAVHFVNEGDARPTSLPPRPYERGIGGRPTVVQNVESLAYAALIARFGAGWYRELGRGVARGTSLLTVTTPSGRTSVHEAELGTTIGELASAAGITDPSAVQAVLIGGFFGGWILAGEAWRTPLDPLFLRAHDRSLGAGVVSFLAASDCPVRTTARIAEYMAGQSAAQCGPCVYGLRAIADATTRIARFAASGDDLARLERWAGQVRNRGACRHPDGAVGLLTRALQTFGDDFEAHQRARQCVVADRSRWAGAAAELVA
jgi:NADH:ubiquinone oxidoreductase subunit F (NADH-binding)